MIAHSKLIFKSGIDSVLPDALMKSIISFDGTRLVVGPREFTLPQEGKIYAIGVGKAAAAMAKSLEEILGEAIHGGVVIAKYGHAIPLQKIAVYEAGHPVPDENGLIATRQLLASLSGVTDRDIVIFLLSGGASSLLIDLPDGATLPQVTELFTALLKSGATIHEFNTVRKHLSAIKGGGLLKYTHPAITVSLIISDVPDDDLATIGSGPTIADTTTPGEAKDILRKYNLWGGMEPALRRPIETGLYGMLNKMPAQNDEQQEKAYSLLVANNRLALRAAAGKAAALGYEVFIYPGVLQGEAREVAGKIIDLVAGQQKSGKTCFLFGAETTVQVKGSGKGGRCQELVLAAFHVIKSMPSRLVFFAAGTDGQDGPTDVAGAVIDADSLARARVMNVDDQAYLENNDAYHFFTTIGGHVVTGPTYTNVMDMVIVLTE